MEGTGQYEQAGKKRGAVEVHEGEKTDPKKKDTPRHSPANDGTPAGRPVFRIEKGKRDALLRRGGKGAEKRMLKGERSSKTSTKGGVKREGSRRRNRDKREKGFS